MDNNTVTLIDYFARSVGNLNGNQTTSILSNIYYVVACADCGNPMVGIYS